jgi:uncharacterized protein YbjT (DUF2867 family)
MILLTGATGTTGSYLGKLLVDKDAKFKALVRNPKRAEALKELHVDVVEGDLSFPDSVDVAMHGVDKLFLLSSADENQVELQTNAIEAAKEAGVKYVVKLSVLGAAPDSPVRLGRDHAAIEKVIQESGMDYTILRPGWFMQNLLDSAPTIIASGEFFGASGDGKAALVDARDIAAVAAELLTEDGRPGEVLEVSGPEALSFADVASGFATVLEKPVKYLDVPAEALKDGMVNAGVPEWLAADLVTLQGLCREGHHAMVTSTVKDITGREPRDFDTFVRDYVRWFTG